MARFYFDLHDDEDVIDNQGRELGGVEEAKLEAVIEAREMIGASVAEGTIDLHHHIDVRDEGGSVIHTVRFGDVVQVVREGRPV